MLGCYVGPAGVAARGVPERFLRASPASAPAATGDGKTRAEGEGP